MTPPEVCGLRAELEQAGLMPDAERCAREYAVGVDAVLSMRRTRPDSLARFAFWAFLHFKLEWSYPRIGRYWRCDHTSVMSGVVTHEKRLLMKGLAAAYPAEVKRGAA